MKLIDKIETSRLIIRPMKQKDLNLFLEFMLDTDSTRFLMFTDDQKTKKGATQIFNSVIKSYGSDNPIHSYSITLKNDTYIGSCGISKIEGFEKIYECYYCLLREFTKNGYASEALKSLIDYCFNILELNEIRAYMHPSNPHSEAVAKRVGMTYDGIKKHPIFRNKGKLYYVNKKD